MSVRLVYRLLCSPGDLLFHLCGVQSRAPRALQIRRCSQRQPPFRDSDSQQPACGLLRAWVVIRGLREAGVVLSVLFSAATLFGLGVVLSSLCVTGFESVGWQAQPC